MLTINELTRWTGLTLFELDMHLTALFFSTILLIFKIKLSMELNYLQIFIPLFVATALNLYLLIIIFIRAVMEDWQYRRAILSNAFHFFRTAMICFFEIFLCYKVEGELEHGKVALESAYFVVFTPIWILLISLSVHACRLL